MASCLKPETGHQRTSGSTTNRRRSKLCRQQSSSSEESIPMTQCPLFRRPSSLELEMLEKGKRTESRRVTGNISLLDVFFPSRTSEVSLTRENNEIALAGCPSSSPDDEDICMIQADIFDDDHQKQRISKGKKEAPGTDVEKYMARREMTPFQERMNAITVIPGAFYCFLLLLSGAWLNQSFVDETIQDMLDGGEMVVDASSCLSSTWLPHLHALPPLPVVAGAFGIICHAPFSFIYHWSYAHRLPAGIARTNHWSRRMDQAMLHVCSASLAYATSGRLDFFLVNLLFNADCFYRQFQTRVRPARNQIRILISTIAYTIPILRRGDIELFSRLWGIFAVSFSLFCFYPIGGWSHSAFHLVVAFVPSLLLDAALELPVSQDQLRFAAQCAVMAKQGLVS